MKIKKIASIQIGYQHRDRAHPISSSSIGTHPIIQIKDLCLDANLKETIFDEGCYLPHIWNHTLYRVTPKGDAIRYRVQQGDVLFLSRGQKTIAIPITQTQQNVIASYYFYIIRPSKGNVNFEYLAWFINQPFSQSYLESHQIGSHIKMIPKTAFENLEINLPDLATQNKIVQLEKLRQKEEYLLSKLTEAKRKFMAGLSLKAASRILIKK